MASPGCQAAFSRLLTISKIDKVIERFEEASFVDGAWSSFSQFFFAVAIQSQVMDVTV